MIRSRLWVGLSRGLLVGLSGLYLLIACAEGSPGASVRVIEPDALSDVLAGPDAPLLLDVRTPEEYADGHLAGSRLVPLGELEGRLAELEAFRTRGVVAYCERGGRAEQALATLHAAGFENLAQLDGSMQRWRGEGRPVER